ncbi:lysozyme [Paenibacillus sp. FSL L8-0463]|uniref:lysozyme n=1 Tax=Paenibacillus sp. FSL L8-0463 TaxID=2954687 RepID=UPI00311A39C8
MIYTVDTTQQSNIDFAPETIAEEIAQNVRTILMTPQGSAPLARSIGLDYGIVDEPYSFAKTRIISEIMSAVAEQEPRAQITEIFFKDDLIDALTGRILAVVQYSLNEEVM